MYIIIEKHELSDLLEEIIREEHSDIPPECVPMENIYMEITEQLQEAFNEEVMYTEEAPLHYDSKFISLARKVFDYIYEFILDPSVNINWVKMIDRRGGLVIHVNTGVPR